MKLHLVSIFALLCAVASVSRASTVSMVRSESVEYNAVIGKAFAADLRAKIKTPGLYSFVNASEWLQMTEEGILFGTPSEQNLGDHKVFVSIKKGTLETLVRVVVHVTDGKTPTVLKFTAKVGEIFKMDLAKETGVKGKYSYNNLPKWLEGMESGVLVGMPEAMDAGSFSFEFAVDKGTLTKAVLEVKAPVAPPKTANAFMARVGEPVAIDLLAMSGIPGNYGIVHAPKWMTLNAQGWLVGTPTEIDRGDDYVSFYVLTSTTKVGYYFNTLVE